LLRYALDSAWEAEDVATVPERIAAFLKGHRQQPYCDGCLEKLLGLGAGANRYMARNATSALAQTTEFRRREDRVLIVGSLEWLSLRSKKKEYRTNSPARSGARSAPRAAYLGVGAWQLTRHFDSWAWIPADPPSPLRWRLHPRPAFLVAG